MAAIEPTALLDGNVVRVLVGGAPVGSCRFNGARLVDYEGLPLADTDAAQEAALRRLAERLLSEARQELAAMQKDAYDEDGVDVSLVRWMLSLTPLERLRTLDDHNRFIASGRAALRSDGIFVPEASE